MNETNYIAFIFIFIFTLILTILNTRLFIPFLKKKAEQPIYTDGPSWHSVKSGTPTMGGVSFIIAITLSLMVCSLLEYSRGNKLSSLSIMISSAYALMNASVGIIDDLTKLRHKKNAGLTPRAKLILQFFISILFLIARRLLMQDDTVISFRFCEIDLGFFYYIIGLLILVGITNCANLTDGIDGLASSVAIAIGFCIFYLCYGTQNSVSYIAVSLAAGALGFLIYNINPAKIFMGDTGSLFLGSLVAAIGFELGNPIVSISAGIVYVIEGISVILQVLFYKLYGKRIFKMAPLHHHLEKCGWNESKICLCAIVITLVFFIPVAILCL